jgi:hypothetical protein
MPKRAHWERALPFNMRGKAQVLRTLNESQPEPLIVTAIGKFAAAGEAGNRPANSVDTGKIALAITTAIEIATGKLARGQR